MQRFLKLLTLFLVLLMLVQSTVVSVFAIPHIEVDTGIYQAAGQPSKYSSQYNSGQRDVVATTLNGTSASSYYTGSNVYDVLSEKSSTEIKNALASLMKSVRSVFAVLSSVNTLLSKKSIAGLSEVKASTSILFGTLLFER